MTRMFERYFLFLILKIDISFTRLIGPIPSFDTYFDKKVTASGVVTPVASPGIQIIHHYYPNHTGIVRKFSLWYSVLQGPSNGSQPSESVPMVSSAVGRKDILRLLKNPFKNEKVS